MPGHKEEHKNWIRSHGDDIIDVLRKGSQYGASFKERDTIFVVIPSLHDGSLVMGETYRAMRDEISTEFPFGYAHEGESETDTAKRIATDQVHAVSDDPIFIGEVFPSPGLLDTKIMLYSVHVSSASIEKMKPTGDMLSLHVMSIQEITEVIAKGGITDAVTVASLMKYLTRAKEGIGGLTARLKEIEIYDRHNRLITSIKTNKPEWSFIEYAKGNPDAHEWRFKMDPAWRPTAAEPKALIDASSKEEEPVLSPMHDDIEIIPEPELETTIDENDEPGPPPAFLATPGIQEAEPEPQKVPVVEFRSSCRSAAPRADHSAVERAAPTHERRLNLSMPGEAEEAPEPAPVEPVAKPAPQKTGPSAGARFSGFMKRTIENLTMPPEPVSTKSIPKDTSRAYKPDQNIFGKPLK